MRSVESIKVLAKVAWASDTRPTLSDYHFFESGYLAGYRKGNAEALAATGADAPRAEDCPDCDGTGYIDVDRGCGQPPDRDVCSTCEGLPRAEAGEEPGGFRCPDCGVTVPSPGGVCIKCHAKRHQEEPGGRRCGGSGREALVRNGEWKDDSCNEGRGCPDCRGEGE